MQGRHEELMIAQDGQEHAAARFHIASNQEQSRGLPPEAHFLQ